MIPNWMGEAVMRSCLVIVTGEKSYWQDLVYKMCSDPMLALVFGIRLTGPPFLIKLNRVSRDNC